MVSRLRRWASPRAVAARGWSVAPEAEQYKKTLERRWARKATLWALVGGLLPMPWTLRCACGCDRRAMTYRHIFGRARDCRLWLTPLAFQCARRLGGGIEGGRLVRTGKGIKVLPLFEKTLRPVQGRERVEAA